MTSVADPDKEACGLPDLATQEELKDDASSKESPKSAARTFWREVGSTVIKSLRANRIPAAVSFLLGVVMVAIYYGGGDATRPGFEALGELRNDGGLLFSTVSTCLSAGVFPSLLQAALGILPQPRVSNAAFNIVLWAFLGYVVDRLYFFQAWLFGDGADAATVVKKVLFDQFVWNPFLANIFLSFVFRWRDHGFSLRRCREVLNPRGWALNYCSMLITCWGTWIPGTTVVYCFPTTLQMPAFNVILLMYSSLLSLVSQGASGSASKQTSSEDPAVSGMPGSVPAKTEEDEAVSFSV
eukprot:gb/GFBE01062767.1/.p1 GENE.gb/GFBE01062767.1/~~gb/GFBE01062767.1/.p1  ORF type:complete len:297 (+),score=69.22 gb/GFBE01062767.1/:1-891(+)